MNRVAECCCGDLKVDVIGQPEQHVMCHCKNCRKRTGSAFGLSAYYKRERLIGIYGKFTRFDLHNPNDGFDQQRFYCSRCGTTLCWLVSGYPHLIGIAGGCFDASPQDTPGYSTSTDSKLPWVELPKGIRKRPD